MKLTREDIQYLKENGYKGSYLDIIKILNSEDKSDISELKKGGLTASKAAKMLEDNQAQGHSLTEKQKIFFRAISHRWKPKMQEGGEIVPTYPATLPSGWTYSYLASPKYEERLRNQIRKDIDEEAKEYRKEYEHTPSTLKIFEEYYKEYLDECTNEAIQNSLSNIKKGRVILKQPDENGRGTNYHESRTSDIYVDYSMDALPHELSHRNSIMGTSSHLGPEYIDIFNRYKPRNEIQRIYKKKGEQFMQDYETPFFKAISLLDLSNQVYDLNAGIHNIDSDEVKSDIYDLRYKLYNKGIYDARKQDFTKKHLEKAKKLFKDHKILKRLFDAYEDEDLIHLMNTVAQNKQEEQPIQKV